MKLKFLLVGIISSLLSFQFIAEEEVEEVVVTGSYIKSSPTDGASPVEIVDRSEIDDLGATSIAVPGQVEGMRVALENFGTNSWEKTLQPAILVKGGDWTIDRIVGKDSVEKQGGVVTSIPLISGVSTSLIIERIQKMYKASGHT